MTDDGDLLLAEGRDDRRHVADEMVHGVTREFIGLVAATTSTEVNGRDAKTGRHQLGHDVIP